MIFRVRMGCRREMGEYAFTGDYGIGNMAGIALALGICRADNMARYIHALHGTVIIPS